MMTITYPVKNGLYVNMTNRCPCACTFCLRQKGEGVYGSNSLWLEREPTVAEVCESVDAWDPDLFSQLVFCGYGEPTERLEDLLAVARHVKETRDWTIRLNTNGLSDLINGESTAQKMKGLIDIASVSLNATNAEDYLRLVRPRFGLPSFEAMLRFAKEAAACLPQVVLTVVDGVTTKEEQQKAAEICRSVGATLRVRPLE